jgi:N-acetylmuramate 1-kinase
MTISFEYSYIFKSPAETEDFAEMLSLWAKPGLAIALSGDLGAGKSTFARAFIKALAKPNDEFDVPSPTFSLIQQYDNTRVPVAHVDLYRLTKTEEAEELGLNEILSNYLVLIEWPELIIDALTVPILTLHFSGSGNERNVKLTAKSKWVEALQRNEVIIEFINITNWKNAKRLFLEGDASSRRYETLSSKQDQTILMDMPYRPDGPIVKNGKTYSAIVHLAEGISAVIAINKYLHDLGYSAPKNLTVDFKNGLAVIERLEGEVHGVKMARGDDMNEPMKTAVNVLSDMSKRQWPGELLLENGSGHKIATFDLEAQLTEVDLMPSWFWPFQKGTSAPASLNESFADIWTPLINVAIPKRPVWMLRDFHSPNLIWMPQRQGLKRTGLIDTQDAVMGNPAYDLVSLLQDARIDVAIDLHDLLLDYYASLRKSETDFNEAFFRRDYAILGAQRASRLLGTFTRLSKRDGKHGYLKHLPRVSNYLVRNLSHPALATLKTWYQAHIPEALSIGEK